MIVLGCVQLETSDIISIIETIVTAAIGIWIGVVVQKNQQNNRAIKEYFIDEINSTNEKYNTFFEQVYEQQITGQKTTEWFKIMNNQFEIFDLNLRKEISINASTLKGLHIEFRNFLTSSEDFNNAFTKPGIILSPVVKNVIMNYQARIKSEVVNIIIAINKSKK